MEGCGKGRKQGRPSRKGSQEGRDTGLRQRDPPREKDIDMSHIEREREREREREQSTDLSEELEDLGLSKIKR